MAREAAAVLVADDNSDIRLLVRLGLARLTCRVVEAETGDDALAVARRVRPAVAILDHDMPGLTGLQVAGALARDPTTASTRVIMASGSIAPDDVGAHRRWGVHAYLPKPFSLAALQALVAELVAEHASQRHHEAQSA
jgi:CheY-like chemotaxis protein